MSKAKQKLDLNIWEYQYVTLTLSSYGSETETEDGTIYTPRTVNGLFIHYDGDRVHLNTLTDNPDSISISIREEIIDFIELLNIEEPMGDTNGSVN